MAKISEKIREAKLSAHVDRKTEEDIGIRTCKMEVSGHQKIGRPKLRWSDVIQQDIKEKGVEAQNRRTWRMKTRWADPQIKKGELEE